MAAGATEPPPLLSIRGLVVEARTASGSQRIVDGIDLDLARGEVVGLVGESGAGKSTLGLAAMGYARDGCRFAAGAVVLDGVDLVKASEVVRRRLRGSRIAYVAQSAAAAFNPAHRLLAQCTEAVIRHGLMSPSAARDAAVALFDRLQLPEPERIGARYPHEVSGGQLQRVMTAMAMMSRPDLVIFDEPTTALDVTTQIEVLVAIREAVSALGMAALYISHDLAVVAQMADRVLVLRHGRTVEAAGTRTMLAAPMADYTRSLWAVRQFRANAKPAIATGAVPLLRANDVTAGYGGLPVLAGISIDVHAGRTLAIVGESGSGKSTLARIVTGLLAPSRGTVEWDGRPLPGAHGARSLAELKGIQMIFQMPDTALNPRRRVRDEIGRPLDLYHGLKGAARQRRIDELLAAIDLDPAIIADRYPAELSGGQKQRVAIARALAAEPRLLICDEVTSALDQLVAEEVLRLLVRLQRELGLTLIMITHDLAIVRAIADDVAVMQGGRIVRQGRKEDVLAPPFDAYTGRLLASVPEMDPDWLDRYLAGRGRADRPVQNI